MKALILALLLGASTWPETTLPVYSGLTCPSVEAARIVANTPIAYSLSEHIERSGCLLLSLSGTVIGETNDFNIGNELYRFRTIKTPDGVVYQLEGRGRGFTA